MVLSFLFVEDVGVDPEEAKRVRAQGKRGAASRAPTNSQSMGLVSPFS